MRKYRERKREEIERNRTWKRMRMKARTRKWPPKVDKVC